MSISISPPFYGGDGDGDVFTTHIPPPYYDRSYSSESSPPSSTSTSTAIVIIVIIIASAVIITASIYLLLRFLSKRFHRSFRTFTAADDVVLHGSSSDGASNQQQCHVASSNFLESLPLFTFGSVKGNLTGADCAVCLSKFEPHDQLRLLPLCCHAFHADCIDAWIVSNMTCPLCRSTVLPSDADILDKILSSENRGNGYNNSNGGSFRIEIGSISRRRGSEMEVVDGEQRSRSRSFSIGSFEYIVDENGYEVSGGSIAHSRGISGSVDKDSSIGINPIQSPPEALAADVAGSRNWLREYVDRLASVSFRSSGRFFSGSSRRTDPVISADDLEANRVGEEISELFRWLSGV